ncbi:hypothetical protein BD309DRAFT_956849 [Dichomitus squalens]|uniref:Uncharacterized protein n=1 Tax=Dichomitus squalens TaxID=114155 RepID=A0A4Q9MUQ3_9APHY|nr:hypothetical protein BD311DRAFT_752585 [Dichomitus squalens]TBU45142.1 hypothetical protein BD309DRAFT_956849 [Dichomitus squalens]
MSISPPIRRLSTNSSSREDLINQYEAEEERIINILSRKLEQLREEKIELENVLEAESESHVNRLSRELSALRLSQQQQAGPSHLNGTDSGSPLDARIAPQLAHLFSRSNGGPSSDMILDALRRENEALRSRLVETEQDFIRISRLNEVYREELIQHRRRLGLPVDSLIGLPQSEPFSQPTHRRSSTGSSPSSSVHIPSNSSHPARHASAVPIPRPPSQIRRPANTISSESTTPLSHSPSSVSTSPFPFSPVTTSPFPASYTSAVTNLTTPPSIGSVAVSPPTFTAGGTRMLSYPSVPPPSLSSSFGSPSTSLHQTWTTSHPISSTSQDHDGTPSPVESFHSRRNSFNRRGSSERRVAETGRLRRSMSRGQSHSRRESVERGARIAETGSLVPRNRSASFGLPETIEDADPNVPSVPRDAERGPGSKTTQAPTPQPTA